MNLDPILSTILSLPNSLVARALSDSADTGAVKPSDDDTSSYFSPTSGILNQQ